MVVNCRSKLQKFMIDDLFPDVEIPKPAVNAAAKTVVSFIPYLGNAISTIWNEFESAQLQRKVERFEELVKTLSNDLTRLETRVNQEYINKPDCADLLEKTVHNIVIERLEEKRLAYKNILINSIVDKNCDFDRTEKYISLLSQMTKIDILLLSTFQNPELTNKQNGYPVKNHSEIKMGNVTHTYQRDYNIYDIIYELWRFNKEDIADSIAFLYQNRLINKDNFVLSTNGHPIHTLDNMLTNKGKEFIRFITTP